MRIITKYTLGFITIWNLFYVALKQSCKTKLTVLHKTAQGGAQRGAQRFAQ